MNKENLATAMKNAIEELEAAIRFRQTELEQMQRCLAACKLIRTEDPVSKDPPPHDLSNHDPDPIGTQLVADITEELKTFPPYRARERLQTALRTVKEGNGDAAN